MSDEAKHEDEDGVFLNLPAPGEACWMAGSPRFRTPAGADLLNRALVAIRKGKRASVSGLQRRLKLTYTEAGAVMEELEAAGFVGPAEGVDPRELLLDRFEAGLRFGAALSAEEAAAMEGGPPAFALQVLPKRIGEDAEGESAGGGTWEGGPADRWAEIRDALGAGSALAEFLARPGDEIGLKALEMAAGLRFEGDAEDTFMGRMLSAVFLEFCLRHGSFLAAEFRRNLRKFQEQPEADPESFKVTVPMELLLMCGPLANGCYPALVSKLGTAKIKAASRNTLAAQLELFDL